MNPGTAVRTKIGRDPARDLREEQEGKRRGTIDCANSGVGNLEMASREIGIPDVESPGVESPGVESFGIENFAAGWTAKQVPRIPGMNRGVDTSALDPSSRRSCLNWSSHNSGPVEKLSVETHNAILLGRGYTYTAASLLASKHVCYATKDGTRQPTLRVR